MLPVMARMADVYPEYQFVVAATPVQPAELYDRLLASRPIKRVTGRTYDLLSVSHAALVTSGTATLETALLGIPEVVCYKGSPVSYLIGRMVVKVREKMLEDFASIRHMLGDGGASQRAAEAIVGFLHQEEDQQTECR